MSDKETTEWEDKCFPSLIYNATCIDRYRILGPDFITVAIDYDDVDDNHVHSTQHMYECNVCASMVTDWRKHAKWHETLGQ